MDTINLNSNKYNVVVIHINNDVEKITDLPNYGAAEHVVGNVLAQNLPKAIAIVDDLGGSFLSWGCPLTIKLAAPFNIDEMIELAS